MTQRLTAEEFQARDGVAEWRVGDSGATARYATGSFARGVDLVNEIGRLADAANHHPDIELTYPTVTVRLITHDEGDAVTDKDAALAAQISAAASRLGIVAAGS
jgi:4a-hydroxytetrahydrobiopterin dehydratase